MGFVLKLSGSGEEEGRTAKRGKENIQNASEGPETVSIPVPSRCVTCFSATSVLLVHIISLSVVEFTYIHPLSIHIYNISIEQQFPMLPESKAAGR